MVQGQGDQPRDTLRPPAHVGIPVMASRGSSDPGLAINGNLKELRLALRSHSKALQKASKLLHMRLPKKTSATMAHTCRVTLALLRINGNDGVMASQYWLGQEKSKHQGKLPEQIYLSDSMSSE